MNLYILDISVPGEGWKPSKVFEADSDNDPSSQDEKTTLLDHEEKYWKDKGCTTVVTMIHGMAVDALKNYFQSKENHSTTLPVKAEIKK